jgi:hypothetical protein
MLPYSSVTPLSCLQALPDGKCSVQAVGRGEQVQTE